MRQKPGETLRAFISRFTKVQDTIPRISDASIITAFRQGVRDEKLLEKLATHEVKALPRFSPWQTSVPGPLRAAHGTQPPKTETPKLAALVLPLTAVARRRRTRIGVAGIHILADQLLQQRRRLRRQLLRQRLGARTRAARARVSRMATAGLALPACHQAGLGGAQLQENPSSQHTSLM